MDRPRAPACDVAVVGAGPAGAVAAAALARAGVRVVLVDRAPGATVNFGECLPPGVRPLLERAGVWSEFSRAGHLPSLGIRSAWGSPDLVDRDFLFSPYGAGWHVDRARFDRLLVDAAIASGATVLAGHTLRTVERGPARRWRLTLSAGTGTTAIHAALVVDASGRGAAFARRAGARRRRVDRLLGVGVHFALPAGVPAMEGVLLVEAVSDGWWYSAPLPDGKLVAVHMTDAVALAPCDLASPGGWRAALDATAHTRRRIERHGGRARGLVTTISADSSRLERAAGEGWLAAGDAAAAFDPLSSQGLMAAIAGGLEAARAACGWLAGDATGLDAYAEGIARAYAAYLVNRGTYYALEGRWPDSPFWRRRHAAYSPRPAARSTSPAAAASIR